MSWPSVFLLTASPLLHVFVRRQQASQFENSDGGSTNAPTENGDIVYLTGDPYISSTETIFGIPGSNYKRWEWNLDFAFRDLPIHDEITTSRTLKDTRRHKRMMDKVKEQHSMKLKFTS